MRTVIRPSSTLATDFVIRQYGNGDTLQIDDAIYLRGDDLNNFLAALAHTRATGERTEIDSGSWRTVPNEEG